jgi:hypothetical protein
MVLQSDSPIVIASAAVAVSPLMWGIWWLWWRLPQRQVARLPLQISDPKARADAEDNFRKTVGQALGGAAVLIGAVVAYLQFTQQQQATRDQLRAAHDLLISNQVSKGFEQLTGKEMIMRLGGIYALEGVMNTSPEYHGLVLEALCAFVRDGTEGKSLPAPATDIQAVLTVIARRRDASGSVSLAHANISGAELSRANLSGADLSNADLSNARLIDAHLSQANLSGTNLRGAKMLGVDFSTDEPPSFDWSGEPDLSGADLGGAKLSGAYNLDGAKLSGARLYIADLRDAPYPGPT